MTKCQKSIDALERRLRDERPEVTLKAESFVRMKDPAIFVDAEYGEWQATPNGVLAGGMHPQRRTRFVNKITVSKEEFRDYYLHQNLSVKELAKKFGTSRGEVLRKIKEFDCKKPMRLKQELMRDTSIERFGVAHAMQTTETKEKMLSNVDTEARYKKTMNTLAERYGVTNISQIPGVKEKRRESMLKRFGVEHALECSKSQEKYKQTTKERYGVENVLHTQHVRDCVKDKLGVEYPFQAVEIQKKVKETFKNKYGALSPAGNPAVQDKIRATILKKYGRHHLSTEEIRTKIKETNIEKWGYPCPLQNPEIQELSYQTRLSKNNFNTSAAELSLRRLIRRWLPEDDVIINSRNIIPPLELDIYIPSKKLAIEYNGLYWHSEDFKSKWYHFTKMQRCSDENIKLITIFEHELEHRAYAVITRLKSLLLANIVRIGARDTHLEQVSNTIDVKKFLNRYHVQGAAPFDKGFLLFHAGKMVAAMTFARHHRQTSKELVLNRFCVRYNYSIAGGASKLLKAALLLYQQDIISYSDNRWSDGALYAQLGFTPGKVLPPDYFYTRDRQYFSKQSLKKNSQEKLSAKTERELRLEQGFRRVYDCGKIKWLLPFSSPD